MVIYFFVTVNEDFSMAEIVVLDILTKSQRKNKINIKGAVCFKLLL